MKHREIKRSRARSGLGRHSRGLEKAKHKKKKNAKKQKRSRTVETGANTRDGGPSTSRGFTVRPYEEQLDPAVLSGFLKTSSKTSSKCRKGKQYHSRMAIHDRYERQKSEPEECLMDQAFLDPPPTHANGRSGGKKKGAKRHFAPLSLNMLWKSKESKRRAKVDSDSDDSSSEEQNESDTEDQSGHDDLTPEEQSEPDAECQSGRQDSESEEHSERDTDNQGATDGGRYYFEDAYACSDEEVSSSEKTSSSGESEGELSSANPMESMNMGHTTLNSSAYCADNENDEDCCPQFDLHSSTHNPSLRVFRLEEKLLLVFVQQPTVLQLTGRAVLRVLYGTLDIDGYLMNPGNPLNKGGLFIQCGLLSPPTTMKPMAPQRDSVYTKLMEELEEIAPRAWETVSPNFDRNATVVLLKKAEGRWPAFELVIDSVIKLPELNGDHAALGFDLKSAKNNQHPWSPQFPTLAKKLLKAASSSEQQMPQVVICGPKNSGKSMFSRLLTNTLLNMCPEVMYLDCDPGQTEFSPPGTLSLVKVTHPLLGPPFVHLHTPEKMYFLGDVSPAASPDSYSSAIRSLIEYKNQHFPSVPLVVNTMGWLSGIGLSVFVDVIRWLNPTDLVQLAPAAALAGTASSTDPPLLNAPAIEMGCGWLSSRSEALCNGKKAVLSSTFASHHIRGLEGKASSPRQMRQAMLLSYISKKHSTSAYCPWSDVPYSVPWSAFAVHEHTFTVLKKDLLHVLNGSLVALCKVPKELLLKTDVEGYPMFIKGNPLYECIGFGIVRAIDPVEKVFYILTPEPRNRLAEINALIKGSINIPEVLLTKQARFLKRGQSLPYLMRVTRSDESSEDTEQRTD